MFWYKLRKRYCQNMAMKCFD